jgi:4-amino-4-deoxy-L-arabinose transferase-like glycosyltransferase
VSDPTPEIAANSGQENRVTKPKTQPTVGVESGRSFLVALGAIAGLALVVRIIFIVVVDPTVPPLGDASAYRLLAEQLAHGQGYIRPFDNLLLHVHRPTAEYPPLFPLLLALPVRAGVHSVEGLRIFVAFVGAGTVALVGLLGRRVASPAAGLIAAALAAIYPMLFLSEATLMAESLYVALVTIVLLAAYRAFDEPTRARFAALGLAIGLATLTRAEGLLLGIIVVVPLALWLRDLPGRERAARALIALGIAVVVLLPWTLRNVVHFHTFIPVSNNVSTLIDGANCDATYRGEQIGLWRETFSQPGTRATNLPQSQACFEGFDIADPNFDEAQAARTHTRAGLNYARDNVSALPKVAAVRVLRTWAAYAPRQQIDFESLEGRPRAWQLRGTVMYWILVPFAVAGAVVLRRRRRLLWPLAATAVTVTVVSAMTYGQQRFRIAAEPAILVLGAVALEAIWNAWRASRARSDSLTGAPPIGAPEAIG